MPERDSKGRFVKGNRGNPNPVCQFAPGNLAAVKHMSYANTYMRRQFALYDYLTKAFYQHYPDGSPEDHKNYIHDNWVNLMPDSWQVYRNKPREN
ncbi:hypothetical protein AB3Y13_11400 [Vibrio alginolyticus]